MLGSLEQPPPGAQAGGSKLKKFYENAGATVEVIAGAAGSAARLKAMLGCNAPPRTLALRDYYPGWEASGCQAHGGKPIMVERSLTTLEIFFDDHITAHDAHIIDASAPPPFARPFMFSHHAVAPVLHFSIFGHCSR